MRHVGIVPGILHDTSLDPARPGVPMGDRKLRSLTPRQSDPHHIRPLAGPQRDQRGPRGGGRACSGGPAAAQGSGRIIHGCTIPSMWRLARVTASLAGIYGSPGTKASGRRRSLCASGRNPGRRHTDNRNDALFLDLKQGGGGVEPLAQAEPAAFAAAYDHARGQTHDVKQRRIGQRRLSGRGRRLPLAHFGIILRSGRNV